MVAHPKNLSPRTLFAIDQYLLGGGKAAIFVDPLAESEAGAGGGPMGGASSSTLQPIFDAWGLEMPTDKVVADSFAARRVGARTEERRVGKECVHTCRSRWSPSH